MSRFLVRCTVEGCVRVCLIVCVCDIIISYHVYAVDCASMGCLSLLSDWSRIQRTGSQEIPKCPFPLKCFLLG